MDIREVAGKAVKKAQEVVSDVKAGITDVKTEVRKIEYESERATLIKDGSFSVLSIFPVDIEVPEDAESKEFFATLFPWEELLRNNGLGFISRQDGCPLGCGGCKNSDFECDCFEVVDSFIGVDPATGRRMYVGTTFLKWTGKPLRVDIFVKFFLKRKVGILNFNLDVSGFTAQEIIALKHRLGGEKAFDLNELKIFFAPQKEEIIYSIPDYEGGVLFSLFGQLSGIIACRVSRTLGDRIEASRKRVKKFFKTGRKSEPRESDPMASAIVDYDPKYCMQTIIELREAGEFPSVTADANKWAREHAQLVYGLLSGDEGVGFIPDELALQRISNHWGSRSFMDTIAIGSNVMLINAKTTAADGKNYIDFQKKWNETYSGGEKRLKYFTGKPCMAGFDHGVLNAVERNIVIGFYYDFIDQQELNSSRKLNRQRRQLISFISTSLSPIREINELYSVISGASGLDKSIGQVRNRLDIQSEDIDIDYQYKNNAIINWLTVISLVLAVLALENAETGALVYSLIEGKPWYMCLLMFAVALIMAYLLIKGIVALGTWIGRKLFR